MKRTILKKTAGVACLCFGIAGIGGLLFFYSTVLFSDAWQPLQGFYEMFRLIFTIPTGIVVIYASFLSILIPLGALVLLGLWLVFQKRYIGKIGITLLCVVWVLAILLDSLTTLHQVQKIIERIAPFSQNPVAFDVKSEIPDTVRYVFRTTLKNEANGTFGIPEDGYEPYMFLKVFPGLTETDFENVEASIGHYTVEDGKLVHKTDDTKLIHSAAKAITDRGIDTLLANVSVRLGVDLNQAGTITEIIDALVRNPQKPPVINTNQNPPVATPGDNGGMVACTADAKLCPDGSAVGRQGPNCEFAACPAVSTPSTHMCTPQEKSAQACTLEYRPVCASVAVQCIKAPCPPVPQTFGNGCSACSQSLVTSYTEGACSE